MADRGDPVAARHDPEHLRDALGVPVATLRNWEQGRTQPDPAAVALLRIVEREPEAAFRALGVAYRAPAEQQG